MYCTSTYNLVTFEKKKSIWEEGRGIHVDIVAYKFDQYDWFP